MDQNDWLPVPNLICRLCGVLLDVKAMEKRPVTEFYAMHPKEGMCPLRADWVRLDSKGHITENISEGKDWR